jgi:hypothetical protein
MARIGTYVVDTVVTLLDKWIGTDSAGGATKNFTAQSIADLFNENSSIGILGQNNFLFQSNINTGRQPGTISFTAGKGEGTAFSNISTIKVSNNSSAGNYIVDYLETLVGEYVMLAQIDNLNNFGIYKLSALTQDVAEPTFYNASFTLTDSNGVLAIDKYYGFAVYPNPVDVVGDKNFVFTQDVASNTWVIQHNLNKFPSVTSVNINNIEMYGEVVFTDVNNLTINFTSASSGKAYIN